MGWLASESGAEKGSLQPRSVSFSEIAFNEKSAEFVHEQRRVLERHWDLAEQLYGEARTGPQLRKFGIKYAASHPRHLEVRPQFTHVRSRAEWDQVLDTWYSEDLPGVFPSPDIHHVQGSSCSDYWVPNG